jgi:hypothetical protein
MTKEEIKRKVHTKKGETCASQELHTQNRDKTTWSSIKTNSSVAATIGKTHSDISSPQMSSQKNWTN